MNATERMVLLALVGQALLLTACGTNPASSALEVPSAAELPTTSTGFAPAHSSLSEEAAVVLNDFHLAAAQADEARYFAHFAEGGIFLGTDATERWTVGEFREYAHPFFERGRAWTFRATRRAVDSTEDGSILFFDEDLETEGLGPARGSGVLVRVAGVFKIAQYNLALTIPNERFAEVKALLESETQTEN